VAVPYLAREWLPTGFGPRLVGHDGGFSAGVLLLPLAAADSLKRD
jgi:hypothetical protein